MASQVVAARTDCSTPVCAAFVQRFQAAPPVEEAQRADAAFKGGEVAPSSVGARPPEKHTQSRTHAHAYTFIRTQYWATEAGGGTSLGVFFVVFLRFKTDKHLQEAGGRQRGRMNKGTK